MDTPVLPLFLPSLLFLLSGFSLAQSGGRSQINDSLTAGDNSSAWLSPSGDFAFGFRPVNRSGDSNSLYLLCIWYARIPERTIVWYANGDSLAPAGSVVQLTDPSGIVLRSPQGFELWRSGQLTCRVDSALTTDAGNFVILGLNASSPMWETFSNPTDTNLPSQTLDRGVSLSCRRTETNFSRGSIIVVVSVLLGFSAFVNVVFVIADCFGFHLTSRKKNMGRSHHSSGDGIVEPKLICFTYEDLEDATNGFDEELERGAFGKVYKGELQNGILIAVKKLDSFGQEGSKEFRNEVAAIGQTHHRNLVRLIGYCDDRNDRKLLVYEYSSNGTLAEYLFRDSKPGWGERIQMALGIARGLLYLHEECSTQVIIHCDIKPQNILLDNRNNPKISNFEQAVLLGLDQSQTQAEIRGTNGFVAPEWFRGSPITVKIDVYSFGILLLEIVCCRRNVDDATESERAVLNYWAYDCYFDGTIGNLVEHEVEAMSDGDKLEKYVMIVIWCIQEDPSLRPTMKQVWQMLEGVTDVPVPPCPTPYTLMIE